MYKVSQGGEKIMCICEWGTYLASFLILYGEGIPIIIMSSVCIWNYNIKWARIYELFHEFKHFHQSKKKKLVVEVHNFVQKDKKKRVEKVWILDRLNQATLKLKFHIIIENLSEGSTVMITGA